MKFSPPACVTVLILGFASCSTLPPGDHFRTTEDGSSKLSVTGQNLRLETMGLDLSFKAPAGWKVTDCIAEPLDWDFAGSSPDETLEFGMIVNRYAGNPPEAQRYRSYLKTIWSVNDPKVRMTPEAPFHLKDGRSIVPYRYFSSYWKQRLVVMIPEGEPTAVFEFEAPTIEALRKLRPAIQGVMESYSATRKGGR